MAIVDIPTVSAICVVEFIDGMNMTVGRWKTLRLRDVPVVTEVRRCDMTGRRLRQPPEKPKPVVILGGNQIKHWDNSKHRRPRNSNKIKKVK